MGKIAFIYPGQGAQKIGMGKDFYETKPNARRIFDEADKVLDFDIKNICFEENELINNTKYTQAALVTTCLAITKEVENLGIKPDVAAGLSLGEYCAMAAAGVMSGEDAIRIVRRRGILMQEAVPAGQGAMAAVLAMKAEDIEHILENMEEVQIANYNCPGQIVISGTTQGIATACEKLKAAGAKRALPLKVGGAFHSPLMEPARKELADAIMNTHFSQPSCPVYQNVNAQPVSDPEVIKRT